MRLKLRSIPFTFAPVMNEDSRETQSENRQKDVKTETEIEIERERSGARVGHQLSWGRVKRE